MAILKVMFAPSDQTYFRAPASANFALGLKYGIVAAGLLVFLVGIIQLDNFMGPLQVCIDAIYAKLLGLVS